jgi:filamentous hemagglutinin
MTRKTTKAGAGGNWKRINERYDKSVVKQVNDLSCVSAVGEMLAKDFGLNVSQAEILKEIGSPSNADGLTKFPNEIDVEKKWVGGFFPFEVKFIRGITESTKSWAVILREGKWLGHAVLIYGIDENGLVKIRDPFDQTMYEMTVEDLFDVLSEFVVRKL